MAALENDHLVVRVAYTGPPMAGKTQSVRALLPLLNGKGTELSVMSPGEWRGRTAYFDWAYYEGGAFEGRSIRCQIISTPGQVALSDRRELILRSADAVILVVDSQLEAIERAIQCYEEMAPWLEEAGRDTPIRVLLQCNKQDLPGSIPPEELSRALGLPFGKEVYPTSARTGKGLRAAFVAGVRVAVERARALLAKGQVLEAPAVRTGEELYELMQRDAALRGSESPQVAPPPLRSSPPSERATRRVPVSSAPSKGEASSSVRAAARSRSAPPSRPPWSRLISGKPSEAPSAPGHSGTNAPRVPAPASTSAAPVASAPRSVPSEPPRAAAPALPGTVRTSAPATRSAPLPAGADRAASRADRAAARAEAAVEGAPQSSTRHAVPPSRSLLVESKAPVAPAVIEVRSVVKAPLLRLDPAGKAARAWRPEGGARPAVMPASAYYALVVPAYEPGASVQTPSGPRDPGPPIAPDLRRASQNPRNAATRLTVPALSRATSIVPGGARPAVMPAAAYYATLPPAELGGDVNAFTSNTLAAMDLSAGPASAGTPLAPAGASARAGAPARAPHVPRPSASAPPLARTAAGARPAVMPASAYHAAPQAAASPDDHGTQGARDGAAAAPATNGPLAPPSRASVRAPSATSAFRAGLAPAYGARPAVMPASAWRAPFAEHPARAANETGASRVPMRLLAGGSQSPRRDDSQAPAPRTPLELVKRPAVMPASAWFGNGSAVSRSMPPAQATAGAKSQARPAVMPASAWRALQQMLNVAALDAAASPALFDDPPTLPSRALTNLPAHAPFEVALPEPSGSFWIPETPPGLRGLSGSAAPRAFSAGESPTYALPGAEPRLPGQARAPSAVWRRTTWRMLETQTTEGGRALEDARGRWIGELAPGWYARTLNSATDPRAARRAFAEEVLRQRRLARYLSEPRCLALTEEADRFWIWQVACRVPTLAGSLGRLLATREGPSAMAEALIEVAVGYLAARASFAQAPEPLPLSVLTLGMRDGRPVYAGLMPDAGSTLARPREDSDAAFADALQKKWREVPESAVSLEELLLQLSHKAVGRLPETMLEIIRAALVQN